MPDVPSTMSQAKLSETNFRDMYQGIEKGSMAYKLLSSMGWKEGEGLVRIFLATCKAVAVNDAY